MEEKSTFWKSAMTYGLILSLVFVLYSVVLYVSGLLLNPIAGYASNLIYILGILYAQIQYRNRELNGFISYGKAYGFGVAIMIFVGVISGFFTLVLYTFIDPTLIDQVKILQEQAVLKKGLTDDQVDAAVSMASNFMNPTFIAFSAFIGSIISGAIISLLTSLFVKKESNPDAFEEAMKEVDVEK